MWSPQSGVTEKSDTYGIALAARAMGVAFAWWWISAPRTRTPHTHTEANRVRVRECAAHVCAHRGVGAVLRTIGPVDIELRFGGKLPQRLDVAGRCAAHRIRLVHRPSNHRVTAAQQVMHELGKLLVATTRSRACVVGILDASMVTWLRRIVGRRRAAEEVDDGDELQVERRVCARGHRQGLLGVGECAADGRRLERRVVILRQGNFWWVRSFWCLGGRLVDGGRRGGGAIGKAESPHASRD
jgi:hypothetical protein